MYWNKQEQVIFNIVLFILILLQITTIFILKNIETTVEYDIILVGINIILFMVTIPYAKWVWKTTSYRKAFLQVAKHELIILSVSAIGVLLAMLITKLKI